LVKHSLIKLSLGQIFLTSMKIADCHIFSSGDMNLDVTAANGAFQKPSKADKHIAFQKTDDDNPPLL